jgi:hypothetical protein
MAAAGGGTAFAAHAAGRRAPQSATVMAEPAEL